jgi:hypothetical protein
MASRGERALFRVIVDAQGRRYEVYARKVSPGELLGFVAVEGLSFGERSSVVLDPAEERIKAEFADVKRFHVPLHAVVRIDEVAKRGSAKVTTLATGERAPVLPFPPHRK